MYRNRHSRFISEYVKARHNDIYMEADQIFRDIQEKNPHKKDMCKTEEFLKITAQYTSYAHYYNRRKTTSKKPGNKDNMVCNIAPKKPKNEDNMVLNIQLISSEETSTKNKDEIPPPAIILEQETQDEIPPPAILELETQDEIPPPAIPELETPQLPIPDHVYEDLLRELRNDPDLYRIFNDIDILDNENQQADTTVDNDDMDNENQQADTTVDNDDMDNESQQADTTVDNDDMDNESQQADTTVDNDDMDISDNESQQAGTTVSNDDMWDVFNIINEQTPLECELLRLGFN